MKRKDGWGLLNKEFIIQRRVKEAQTINFVFRKRQDEYEGGREGCAVKASVSSAGKPEWKSPENWIRETLGNHYINFRWKARVKGYRYWVCQITRVEQKRENTTSTLSTKKKRLSVLAGWPSRTRRALAGAVGLSGGLTSSLLRDPSDQYLCRQRNSPSPYSLCHPAILPISRGSTWILPGLEPLQLLASLP